MQKKVMDLFEKIQEVSGLAGGAAALIRNGKVDTWFFGHSDRETGLPVSEETYFDIASCSKSFTAMTAALAVDKGWLKWDTPIQKYLPDFGVADPALSAEITMRDLLSHRTGLPRHDFIDNLKIFSLLANVADVKSLVIHPATTTHSQLSSDELLDQGIKPNTIRLSIGTEHIDDILSDLQAGFDAVKEG